MNRELRNGCALSVLLALGWPALASSTARETAAPEPRITVCVYNYARVPARIMRPAREKTTWAFRQAGIEVDWADCTASATDDPANRPASGSRINPTWIAVGILPRSMTKRTAQPRGVFGLALHSQSGGFGRSAYVFFDRVEVHASFINCYLPTLLAWAMSHEIGHLLLGTGSHSSTGMMRATWKRSDLKHVERQSLTFSRNESAKARVQVQARMEAARDKS